MKNNILWRRSCGVLKIMTSLAVQVSFDVFENGKNCAFIKFQPREINLRVLRAYNWNFLLKIRNFDTNLINQI